MRERVTDCVFRLLTTPLFTNGSVAASASASARCPRASTTPPVRGLCRRATFYLRDRGFDVLEVGNTREREDSTVVLDRSGHPEWARRVAHAMGGARVESRPDSSRYLDVTVLVGRTWRPPAEPFHP